MHSNVYILEIKLKTNFSKIRVILIHNMYIYMKVKYLFTKLKCENCFVNNANYVLLKKMEFIKRIIIRLQNISSRISK